MADMGMASLVADLKASLFDSAQVFSVAGDDDAQFKRFLAQALPDLQVKRPVTRLGTVTLVAGEASYLVPDADFAALKVDLWRDPGKLPRPWEAGYPGALPHVSAVREDAQPVTDWDEYYAEWPYGRWRLHFDPAPTALHLACLGTSCKYWYFAVHRIDAAAAQTSVSPQDRGLLLLRAQAEAMLALSLRNAGKPVQLRDGMSGTPRNSTPAALAQQLMDLFWGAR